MAMQTAIGKERFNYISAFIGLAFVVLPIAAHKKHAPQMVAPLVPLSILWCFQYDMYYGNMMRRAQREAARTIKEEPERFFLPPGTGIVDQPRYNEIIGKPVDYKPKLNQTDNVFTSLHKNMMGGHGK